MAIFTNSDIYLDLSNYGLQFSETNSWFTDELFSITSLPIDIAIDDHLEFYRSYSSLEYPSYFEGTFKWNNRLSKARLEIMQATDAILSVIIEFGLDEFPNWEKKLNELPLQMKSVDNIRNHASQIIYQSYPEVNYNFPSVHTDGYDTSTSVWVAFEGTYNKRKDGAFLENSIDIPNNKVYNRTIMRPMPYLMHILKTGIQDAGFTLNGSILDDKQLQNVVIIPSAKFEIKNRPGSIDWVVGPSDIEFLPGNNTMGMYISEQQILHHGKFKLKGKVYKGALIKNSIVQIELNGKVIYFSDFKSNVINIEFEFTTTKEQSNYLKFTSFGPKGMVKSEMEIIPIILFDENGNEIIYSTDTNFIDLKNSVPDITFGEFVQFVQKLKNYSFDLLNGHEIHMNSRESHVNHNDGIDYQFLEVKDPVRSFKSGDSYHLHYKTIENELAINEEIFIDQSGIKTTGFTTNDKTINYEIPCIVLPLVELSGIRTAKIITDSANEINIALYPGITNSQNNTQDMGYFRIANIYQECYSRWITSYLNSVGYHWNFKVHNSDLYDFSIKNKIFCYNNYHFIKSVTITKLTHEIDEYDIETITIRPKKATI